MSKLGETVITTAEDPDLAWYIAARPAAELRKRHLTGNYGIKVQALPGRHLFYLTLVHYENYDNRGDHGDRPAA